MEQDKQAPVVSIISLTYNHAPYIRECMDGFLMQQTDFPYEVIIHDDASTDGTTDIVKEYVTKYPDIIKPILQTENQYSKHHDFNRIIQTCFEKCQGKYIAFCEGDDYWIDPLKLQKQVDFLNYNKEFGLVYSMVQSYIQRQEKLGEIWGGENESFRELLSRNTIPTLTTLCRRTLLKEYFGNMSSKLINWLMGDYPIWLYISYHSKVHFQREITGIYRILDNSASHCVKYIHQLEFSKSGLLIKKYFMNLFNYFDYDLDSEIEFKLRYLDMRIALLSGNDIQDKISSFWKTLFWKQTQLKNKIRYVGWYLCPKLLSIIAEKRFRYRN